MKISGDKKDESQIKTEMKDKVKNISKGTVTAPKQCGRTSRIV